MADEDSLVSRLMRRGDDELYRVTTPDGGEVYKGPLAKRALEALGARAFTMDETIFVDDDFDLSTPEDQALYAHEVHHQMESGGIDDGHSGYDHEEFAARAIESMVLHRSQAGEAFGTIMRDVRAGGASGTVTAGAGRTIVPRSGSAGQDAQADKEDPMAAYAALRNQGKSHEQVVRELAEFVLRSIDQIQTDTAFRRGSADWV